MIHTCTYNHRRIRRLVTTQHSSYPVLYHISPLQSVHFGSCCTYYRYQNICIHTSAFAIILALYCCTLIVTRHFSITQFKYIHAVDTIKLESTVSLSLDFRVTVEYYQPILTVISTFPVSIHDYHRLYLP